MGLSTVPKSRETLSESTRRGLGFLFLAAALFAYFTLAEGGPWGGQVRQGKARPADLPLSEWLDAPLVVHLHAGEDGQLRLAARADFEAGVGTLSIWLGEAPLGASAEGSAAPLAEFVNYDALYPGESSAAWSGELRLAPQAVRALWARHRGKLLTAAQDFRCTAGRPVHVEAAAAEMIWYCEFD